MKNKPKFKRGDVVLMHMPDEDQDNDLELWVEDEIGVVDGAEGWDEELQEPEGAWPRKGHSWMYIVTVPRHLRRSEEDMDGMREVDEKQLSLYSVDGVFVGKMS